MIGRHLWIIYKKNIHAQYADETSQKRTGNHNELTYTHTHTHTHTKVKGTEYIYIYIYIAKHTQQNTKINIHTVIQPTD